MAYAIVNLDRMSGTKDPANLVSVQYYVNTTKTAVQNGSIVVLNGLDDNQREVFKAIAVADADDAASTVGNGALFLIASPEYMTDNSKLMSEFTNPTTEPARAYRLCYGDIFGVTADAFYGTTQPTSTNKYVTLYGNGNVLMTGVSSASNNKIGEFIGSQSIGGVTFYFIHVCK
jgi:hypothetical protein